MLTSLSDKIAAAHAAIKTGKRVSVIGSWGVALVGPTRSISEIEYSLELNPHATIRIDGETAPVPASVSQPTTQRAPADPHARTHGSTSEPQCAKPRVAIAPAIIPAPIAVPVFQEGPIDPNLIANMSAAMGDMLDAVEQMVGMLGKLDLKKMPRADLERLADGAMDEIDRRDNTNSNP